MKFTLSDNTWHLLPAIILYRVISAIVWLLFGIGTVIMLPWVIIGSQLEKYLENRLDAK